MGREKECWDICNLKINKGLLWQNQEQAKKE